MTQEPDLRSSSTNTHKRSSRAGRNRPLLVTSTEQGENVGEQAEPDVAIAAEEHAQNASSMTSPAPARRRLPNFFSTVGKSTQTEAPQEIDAAQARLARATRGKPSSLSTQGASDTKADQKTEVKRESARSSAPARPPSLFKTRYLFGMVLYLLGANFIGYFETGYLHTYHLDAVLTSFNFFGGTIVISTSTIVFLATLLLILVILARLDLLPRNFSAMLGQTPAQRNKASGSSTRSITVDETRNIPPTMRQGVRGADDDLYQEYRANQRRSRKK